MKISVIIPIKNRANLIGRTLHSIYNQTLKPHEVILVDDNSTDDLESTLKEFGDLRLLRSSGTGPGAARNEGLRIATGDAIQFFDSDDIMTRNKLEVQASLLRKAAEIAFVYGPYIPVVRDELKDEWKQFDSTLQYYSLPNRSLVDLVLEGWCSITQSCLFSRKLIDMVGFWNEELMPHEDKEYWFRIAQQNPEVIHENLSAVLYRQHAQQISNGTEKALEKTLDGIEALKIIYGSTVKGSYNYKSLLILKGMIYHYEKYANVNPKSNGASYIGYLLYKLVSKVERLHSGSSWRSIYGPSTVGIEKYAGLIDG